MVDETKQRLIEAAGEVFSQKGFEATSVREICARANANIAAINYHFGDKSQLYLAAVREAHCARELPAFDWTAETTAERKLHDFVRAMMEMMLRKDNPAWHIELMMRELAQPTLACQHLVREFIGPMFDVLLSIIQQMVPANCPLIDRHMLAFSVVAQCLLYRYHRPIGRLLVGEEEYNQMFDLDRTARQISAFSLAGLRSAASEPLPTSASRLSAEVSS